MLRMSRAAGRRGETAKRAQQAQGAPQGRGAPQGQAAAQARHGEGSASPLGIVAGGGRLPVAVARRAVGAGRPVHIVAIRGAADAEVTAFPHTWVEMGEVGRILAALRGAGCRELIIIGGVKRPDLWRQKYDLGCLVHLPLLLGLTFGGDDTLLGRIIRFFELRGFVVRGAHEIAPELLAGEGALGRLRPGAGELADIETGCRVLEAIGGFDVGQACVVARGHVLAIEAAEGTDRMLMRCRELRQWGDGAAGHRRGVLVKRPKPGQELRVDLPTIGPRTVELAAEAGLKGLAVAGDGVLIAEREAVIARADALGLFVYGLAG